MSVAIHWFRRDLRITDNTALNSAAAEHEEIVPVYILSEWTQEHRWTGPARQEFLCGCLQELSSSLTSAGGRLIIRQGKDQVAVFEDLVRQTGADAIYFNRDPDPHGDRWKRWRDHWALLCIRAKTSLFTSVRRS